MKRKEGSETALLTVKISSEVSSELMYIVKKVAPDEVSGLGEVEVQDGKIIVTRIFLLPQIVSGGSTVMETAGLAAFLGAYDNPEKLKLWWHSHGQGSVFWSTTDTATIKMLMGMGEWLLSVVFNSHGEYLGRLDVMKPVPLPPLSVSLSSEVVLSKERREVLNVMIKERVKKEKVVNKRDGEDEPDTLPDVSESPLLQWMSSVCGDCFFFDRVNGKTCNLKHEDTHSMMSRACNQFTHFSSLERHKKES